MKTRFKDFLGSVPWIAELWQALRGPDRPPTVGYPLDRLTAHLPGWIEASRLAVSNEAVDNPKKILVMGYLRWWLEYAAALSLLFSGQGHAVSLGVIPYKTWTEPISSFDARRLRKYIQQVLSPLHSTVQLIDLSQPGSDALPVSLERSIEELSRIDTQYTMLREEIDLEENQDDLRLYRLRRLRNYDAASASYSLLRANNFDMVIIPNGSVLEFGAVYRTARSLGVPVATYEFGEQRKRLWLVQNDEIMRQDTSDLWEHNGSRPLTEGARKSLEDLMTARRGGRTWATFSKQWQRGQSAGAEAVIKELALDPSRKVALLCTNIVGDSLALDRQVFTDGMADWLQKTVQFIQSCPDLQLIVRVHPGEVRAVGHPSAEIVQKALPEMPGNVHLIPPDSPINTYDLIELADLGLVYTTTVGLEMALSGVPVVVAGQTHYKGKGFTNDPETLQEYFDVIDRLRETEARPTLSHEQIESAWRYARMYFFEYPHPFPWHIIDFWDDMADRPFEEIVTAEGRKPYQRTLNAFIGTVVESDVESEELIGVGAP